MGKKHSLANKKKWAEMPKEKKSLIFSKIATKRYENMPVLERKEIGKRLLLSRQKT